MRRAGEEHPPLGTVTPLCSCMAPTGTHRLWQSRQQGCCPYLHPELAGAAHVVCAMLVKKGKIETSQLYSHVQLYRSICQCLAAGEDRRTGNECLN